jgi:hypothetical protein
MMNDVAVRHDEPSASQPTGGETGPRQDFEQMMPPDAPAVSVEREQALSEAVTMAEWVAVVLVLGAFEAFELGVGLMRAAIDQIPVGLARSGNY